MRSHRSIRETYAHRISVRPAVRPYCIHNRNASFQSGALIRIRRNRRARPAQTGEIERGTIEGNDLAETLQRAHTLKANLPFHASPQ
jgi:hypothetical protein